MYKRPLPPELLARVRELRQNATDAEKLLWDLLRNRAVAGFKFRRQHPVQGYILDFYCHEAKIALEVDGGVHAVPEQAEYDAERTRILTENGIRVIRFWNSDVLTDTQKVVEEIYNTLVKED